MWSPTLHAQDPKANEIVWTELTDLPPTSDAQEQLGVAGAFTGVHKGVLIVAGGANFPNGMPWEGGKKVYRDEIFVLQKKQDAYEWITSKTAHLPVKKAYGASVSLAEGIVFLGGEQENGVSNKAVLMQWDASKNELIPKSLPDMPVALANAGATSIGNTIYVAGGENNGKPSNQFFALNLSDAAPKWEILPALPVAMSHSVVVAQHNGKQSQVYVLGGRSATASGISDLHSSNFTYDPVKKSWQKLADISDGKQVTTWSAGTGVASGASYILLIGGDKGNVFHQIETFNAQISKAESAELKQKLQAEKVALLTSHKGFSKDIYLYNTIT
ncbi:Kelch repeat-containing protein, partial [Dyadobacter sp.]|uniref:Kelch repeat-containing protein n=1 Tax=Dyadobacter sp. TaxID=1914288 RepID=UPI003F705B30